MGHQVKRSNKPIEIPACSLVREVRVEVRDLGVIRIRGLNSLMAINVEQKKGLGIGA